MKGHRWFAAVYDAMSEGDERVLGPIRRRLVGDLRGRVLEIGAGTGFNFPHYPPDAIIIATEPDPFMLRRAVKRARQPAEPSNGQATIHFVQCAAEALPF